MRLGLFAFLVGETDHFETKSLGEEKSISDFLEEGKLLSGCSML